MFKSKIVLIDLAYQRIEKLVEAKHVLFLIQINLLLWIESVSTKMDCEYMIPNQSPRN